MIDSIKQLLQQEAQAVLNIPVKSSIRWHNIRTSSYWNIFKLSACFFLIIILLYFTHIGCPIKFITGISCPACGMTRAVLAILHGDTPTSKTLVTVPNVNFLILNLPIQKPKASVRKIASSG